MLSVPQEPSDKAVMVIHVWDGFLLPFRHQSRNRSLGNLKSQLQQFPVYAWRSPQWIGGRHGSDQTSGCPNLLAGVLALSAATISTNIV